MSNRVAFAIACHPDDIEFMMSGTLILLKEAGYETHYLNVANGSCGSMKESAARLKPMRKKEGQEAARILGAHFHPSLADDLDIFYEPKLLRRLAAVIRDVRPSILLTHSLHDYMEDHTNTARLTVTAAFARGMPNYATNPRRAPIDGDVTVYHALPHGLRDAMRLRIFPESFVDVSSVHETRLAALAAHRSQQNWLDASQKMSSYLQTMEDVARSVGEMSGSARSRFVLAEGWRRHHYAGFCAKEADPLHDALQKKYRINPGYQRWLDAGLGNS